MGIRLTGTLSAPAVTQGCFTQWRSRVCGSARISDIFCEPCKTDGRSKLHSKGI